MPELPEVETIACGLRPALSGRRIVGVTVHNPGTLEGPLCTPAAFTEAVQGRRIADVGRRGKLLLVAFASLPPVGHAGQPRPEGLSSSTVRDFLVTHGFHAAGCATSVHACAPLLADGQQTSGPVPERGRLAGHGDGMDGTSRTGSTLPGTGGTENSDAVAVADDDTVLGLAFHLKMTGRLFIHPPATPAGIHTRVVFDLEGGTRLFFDDARKFGYVRCITRRSLALWPFWRDLGPEPLETDARGFAARLARRRGRIKALLLDQKVVAGVGNIYADESLFRAGIRPDTQAHTLTPERLFALHGHLQDVLRESIAECGSSIRDYRDAHGDAGAFQNSFRVYGRGGQPCRHCGTTLATAQVAGRTTVFCPQCQR